MTSVSRFVCTRRGSVEYCSFPKCQFSRGRTALVLLARDVCRDEVRSNQWDILRCRAFSAGRFCCRASCLLSWIKFVFLPAKVLIYVFDAETKPEDLDRDLTHYRGVLEAIESNAPDTRWPFFSVHCLSLRTEYKRRNNMYIYILRLQNMSFFLCQTDHGGLLCIFD